MNTTIFESCRAGICRVAAVLVTAFVVPSQAAAIGVNLACAGYDADRCLKGDTRFNFDFTHTGAGRDSFALEKHGKGHAVVARYYEDNDRWFRTMRRRDAGDFGKIDFSERTRHDHLPRGWATKHDFMDDFSHGKREHSPKHGLHGRGAGLHDRLLEKIGRDDRHDMLQAILAAGHAHGLHDQSSAGYFDESLVSPAQVSAVPVPGAVWLFASGLVGLFARLRRRR